MSGPGICVLCLADTCASEGYLVLYPKFDSWIASVCSPYFVSLCDLAYYVVG